MRKAAAKGAVAASKTKRGPTLGGRLINKRAKASKKGEAMEADSDPGDQIQGVKVEKSEDEDGNFEFEA